MKRFVLFAWLCVLQVSDAGQFNASHDSCVPASSPVSQQQIDKLCFPYLYKQRGYCKDVIGNVLVKANAEDQRLAEYDLYNIDRAKNILEATYKLKISRQCVLSFNDVYCRWVYPKCDTSTSNLTAQSICRESCEHVYRMCAQELALGIPFLEQYQIMNCSDMKPTNSGETPECYHTRFSNTETDKLQASECYYGNGLGYHGNVSITRSGHECQSWLSQCPHRHDHPSSEYPELLNASNWCRNPGGQGKNGPWCYTTNSSIRWEYCDVEKCPPPAPSRAPTILRVSTTRGTSKIFVSWRPVPSSFVHGQLRGFRILIVKLDTSRFEKQIVNLTNPNATSVELTNLEPLTNYSLSVLAFNENGDGPPGRAVTVETMPQNFISVRFILTLSKQLFTDQLLNSKSERYQELASHVTRMLSQILKKNKTTGYRIYKIEISRFMHGSVLVEFYVTAEVLGFLPKWSIVQDIAGRMVKRSSSKSGTMDFKSLLVEDVPPPPANVKQGDVTMTSVRVFWSPPLYHEPYRITNYTVQYKKANTKMQYFDAVNVNSNKTKVIVDNLDLDTKYSMRVLSVNGYGSNPSQPIIVNTRGKSSSNTLLIIALSVTAAVVGVASIMIGCAWRRWLKKKQPLLQHNPTNVFDALGIEITKDWWEIPREELLVEDEQLGSGSFGVVKKAYLNMREEGNERTLCAVKMAKENPTERDLRDLCNELNLMTAVGDHPNIISLIGACTLNGPPWLVVKYAVNGSLHDFLKENRTPPIYSNVESVEEREPITTRIKLSFAYDIAQGMSHLEKNRGIMPIRWMSLESLENFTYTTENDVWSYGVVLWEMENGGQLPYAGMFNGQQILEYLKQGHRLETQENTSREIHVIMQECWNPDPKQRPTFSSLVDKLSVLRQRHEEEIRVQDDGYVSESIELHIGGIALQGDNTSYHDNEEIELSGYACGGDVEVRLRDNAGYHGDDGNPDENDATLSSTKQGVTMTTSNNTSEYFV